MCAPNRVHTADQSRFHISPNRAFLNIFKQGIHSTSSVWENRGRSLLEFFSQSGEGETERDLFISCDTMKSISLEYGDAEKCFPFFSGKPKQAKWQKERWLPRNFMWGSCNSGPPLFFCRRVFEAGKIDNSGVFVRGRVRLISGSPTLTPLRGFFCAKMEGVFF